MVRTTHIDTPLWAMATSLLLVLLFAWVFGSFARWVLRRRADLDITTGIVLSILGSAVGLFIAGAIDGNLRVWSPLTIVVELAFSLLAVGAYGALAAHLQRSQRATVSELLASGESERVEFKSTARINLRTGEKDSRMEHVIAKTVSAFANADGGTLLIGVDDDGTPLGLDADFATLKVPDADRYELWLRDLFTTTLGQNAAAAIEISIEDVACATDGDVVRRVCRVICAPSPRPVYLRASKNGTPEFWLRSGNSTRQLSVDAAADYIMHRWPLGMGTSLAAHAKAAVRFSADQ